MKEKTLKNNYLKLVTLIVFVLFTAASISQATVKTYNIKDDDVSSIATLDDPTYEWVDDFNNEQLIESSMSYDYVVSKGSAEIKSTYPIWSDKSWTKLVPITLTNKKGSALENYAIHLNVDYDSDMQNNFADVRFKHENYPTQFLSQWIENYDSNDAEIWVNIPSIPAGDSTLYMFYGNPDAQKESNFYSVFDEWEEEWPNDKKISVHVYTEGSWDPDVCFGNDKFLVVWEEGSAPNPPYTYFYKQDIRGSLYQASGSAVKEDFTIRSGSDPQWHHENPSAAYGGGKFFVAWEHYYTSNDPDSKNIIARFVSTSGNVDNSDIIICEEDDVQGDPMVKFDNKNNRFCVVWEDARNGKNNYNIYGRLYDTNGNTVGGEKNICVESNNQFEPWVAFDPEHEQYMIVYEEKKGDFEIDIYGQLFDKNLNPVGSRFKIADGSSSIRYLYPCVEYSEEADRYLVTYNSGTPAKKYRGSIYGKTYTPSGQERSSAIIKQGQNFVRTDIAPYLETAFLVCFNGGGKIWGRFITVDGEIETYDQMGDIQLSASTSAEADWVNVAVDENEIFVTWEDTRINYASPFNGMPDTYGNIWHLNIGDSSEVTASFGSEKQMILEAQITSKEITADNLFKWDKFTAVSDGAITFDVLNSDGNVISGYESINSGMDLSSINEKVIRLRAHLNRVDPSITPVLDKWKVTYLGIDEEPPRTSIDYIEGEKGLNEYYIEEGVTVWLKSEDFPKNIGSGVDKTYYTLNYGDSQVYNSEGGIHLTVSQSSNWKGEWVVTFWSEDIAGNEEDHGDPDHRIDIKIDAERPYVEVTEPANEQQIEQGEGFWVRADASDNVEIERVEFDIEPFGERPNLPYVDRDPPYEWYCDVGPKSKTKTKDIGVLAGGENVMIRAQVYDKSGQTWLDEIWVFIEDWNENSKPKKADDIKISNLFPLFNHLKFGFLLDESINLDVSSDSFDRVDFTATKIFTREKKVISDIEPADGFNAEFIIPTGFYKITMDAYKEDELLSSDLITNLFFIKV